MKRVSFFANRYTELTLFCIAPESGTVMIRRSHAKRCLVCERIQTVKGCHITWEIAPQTHYTLIAKDVSVPFAYLHGSDDIRETGITVLDVGGARTVAFADMPSWYAQPCRNQYHFSTPKNWMNDPNGLCFFDGYYHLFYQANPFSLKWGDMHWGHAISKDLVHWTHLPMALFPQDPLRERLDLRGGAYSGCAVPSGDHMDLYFTRSLSPLVRGPESRETQQHAVCDGLSVTGETTIIARRPIAGDGDYNFRDPKVVMMDDIQTMIIATTLRGVCSIVAYRKDEEGAWEYKGAILQDPEADCQTFECANYLEEADTDLCAFICSIQDKPSLKRQRRFTFVYLCRRKGLKFEIVGKTVQDFGRGSYAMQLFESPRRVICAFAWCPDTYHEFLPSASRSNGCLTIPHECFLEHGEFIVRPARSLAGLKLPSFWDEAPDEGTATIAVGDTTYEWEISFRGRTDFLLVFCQGGGKSIGLAYHHGELAFVHVPANREMDPPLSQEFPDLRDLDIFVDRSVVEVFVNGGRGYGSLSYFIPKHAKTLSFSFSDPKKVTRNRISMLKGIW
jgi:beta-fructofuranosidase